MATFHSRLLMKMTCFNMKKCSIIFLIFGIISIIYFWGCKNWWTIALPMILVVISLACILYAHFAHRRICNYSLSVYIPSIASLEGHINLVFSIEGTDSVKKFSWKPGPDFKILCGPIFSVNKRISASNGGCQTTPEVTYSYVIKALREGNLSISPSSAIVDGNVITSKTKNITIIKQNFSAEGQPFYKTSGHNSIDNGTEVNNDKNEEANEVLNPYAELSQLIGLSSVKQEIMDLADFVKVQKMRAKQGLKTSPITYHYMFTGNPGTGKTSVARIIAGIYKELGVLKKGHLIETDRSGLVGSHIGETAIKTNTVINQAIDGVLFIDEAYSLLGGYSNDFGYEAISTLLKRMEDDRDKIVIILAGYPTEMKKFIASNPGLQSRFNKTIEFPDYSAEELANIFAKIARQYQYKVSQSAIGIIRDICTEEISKKSRNFGNARFVRNLYEKAIQNHATRLAKLNPNKVSPEMLATIESVDVRW